MEVNGEVFPKPFVEKPVCAEDHNVYIYYPTSAGGGSQRLFRKVTAEEEAERRRCSASADVVLCCSRSAVAAASTLQRAASERPALTSTRSSCPQTAPTSRYGSVHGVRVHTRGAVCHLWMSQVYTVGPDYAHAEARKSPALDGKVERDSEGKEIRYPVMLTSMEKLVARKVCMAFKVGVVGGVSRSLLHFNVSA